MPVSQAASSRIMLSLARKPPTGSARLRAIAGGPSGPISVRSEARIAANGGSSAGRDRSAASITGSMSETSLRSRSSLLS
ncbi:MAG TPA: hypothetical protein VGM12_26780 [Trebonia sp.]|jgi:hypothetical protein